MSNKSKNRKKILEKIALVGVTPTTPIVTSPMLNVQNKISMNEAVKILDSLVDDVCDEIMDDIERSN